MGGFLAYVVARNELPQSYRHMHMLNVISKRTKPSSRDAMMDESHMKGSMRLYVIDSQEGTKSHR